MSAPTTASHSGAENGAKAGDIRFSLRLKLVVLITSAVALTGILLVGHNFRRSREELESELRKRGAVMAANLADGARPLLVAGAAGLGELCASFADQSDVGYVLIIDAQGKVLAQVVREREVDDAFIAVRSWRIAAQPLLPPTTLFSHSAQLYTVTSPVWVQLGKPSKSGDEDLFNIEKQLGGTKGYGNPGTTSSGKRIDAVVEVGMSLNGLRRMERELLFGDAGIIGIVALLGLGAALLIAGPLVRPLNQVAAASDAIADGDLTVRLKAKPRGDEVNKLAVFFNHMVEVLQRQRDEVGGLTRELTRQRDHERMLRDVAILINAADSVSDLVDGLFERIAQAVRVHAGAFYSFEEKSERLLPIGAYALALAGLSPLGLGEGFAGQAAKNRRLVVAEGLPGLAVPTLGDLATPRSVVALPIVFQERLLAVIELATFGHFEPNHLDLLRALAEQGAVALNNLYTRDAVRLARELASKKAELENQNLELARLNIEIQRANEHKSLFLANMSHELRTPLNSIIGFTRLVLKKSGPQLPPLQRENLEKVEGSAVNLLSIINDILDISKIEAGKLDLNSESFHLADLIDEVLAAAAPLVGEKPLKLARRLPPLLPELKTDRMRLRQILVNLTTNALKFTPTGEVTIEVQYLAEVDRVLIAVIDTGIGIAESDRALVFEAFKQVDNSASRKVGGTGLGLTIVRNLCQLLGGSVRLESTVGKGSRFTVDLPRCLDTSRQGGTSGNSPHGSQAVPVEHAPLSRSNRGLAVVIEDNPDDALLLRELLAEQNLDVVSARNGLEGLRIVRELHPDVVTVDIMMPGMDGWAVLRQLKADEGTRDVPVVVVSIVALDGQMQGRELGAVGFVSKPLSGLALREILKKEHIV